MKNPIEVSAEYFLDVEDREGVVTTHVFDVKPKQFERHQPLSASAYARQLVEAIDLVGATGSVSIQAGYPQEELDS